MVASRGAFPRLSHVAWMPSIDLASVTSSGSVGFTTPPPPTPDLGTPLASLPSPVSAGSDSWGTSLAPSQRSRQNASLKRRLVPRLTAGGVREDDRVKRGFPKSKNPDRPTHLGAGPTDLPRSDRYDHLVVKRAQIQVSTCTLQRSVYPLITEHSSNLRGWFSTTSSGGLAESTQSGGDR